jgi:hypothetical protein
MDERLYMVATLRLFLNEVGQCFKEKRLAFFTPVLEEINTTINLN